MCHTANIVKQYTSDEVSFIKFEVYSRQGETVASVSKLHGTCWLHSCPHPTTVLTERM